MDRRSFQIVLLFLVLVLPLGNQPNTIESGAHAAPPTHGYRPIAVVRSSSSSLFRPAQLRTFLDRIEMRRRSTLRRIPLPNPSLVQTRPYQVRPVEETPRIVGTTAGAVESRWRPQTASSVAPDRSGFPLNPPSRTDPGVLVRLPPPEAALSPLGELRELPSLAPATSSPQTSPSQDRGMEAVRTRADALVRHAFSLAERGAHFSAKAEFIQALRIIAQANDAREGTMKYSEALANGLRSLREADDFVPHGSDLEADLHIRSIVAAHRTPVLKNRATDQTGPLEALQRYYGYSQQQLAVTAAGEPTASMALYGLARIEGVISNQSGGAAPMGGAKAMTLHQAALMTDENNVLAGNELGVMLGKYGQLVEARDILLHVISLHPIPEAWHNLAVIQERLGEPELARRARSNYQAVIQESSGSTSVAGTPAVRWVAPGEFVGPELAPPTVTFPSPLAEETRTSRADLPSDHSHPGWWPW